MTGYTFSQLIDFTRTSAATFVNSSGNIASTPQSRNLLTFTNEFANAAWSVTGATVSANVTAAPDGTSTADKITPTASSSIKAVRRTVTSSGANTWSFYAKADGYTKVGIWDHAVTGAYAAFNLTGAGSVLDSGSGASGATITSVGNGWYRCSFTATASGTIGFSFQVLPDAYTTGSVNNPWTGNGTSGVFLWGAQLEQASSATDYTRNFGGLFPPRFDYDPVTRAPRGLLIEEQRTNLLLRSEEFDNASWTKTAASISANATTSPDGTANADKLVEDTANTGHYTWQAPTTTAASHTFSVYVKAAGRSFVLLYHGVSNSGAIFNLTNGAITTPSGVTLATASATDAGNGWYRCSITVTATAASNEFRIQLANSSTNYSYLGDGASGVFLYGAQVEAGAFATSYISTVASQVTRSADQAAINAPNFAPWFNGTAGTLVAEWMYAGANSAASPNTRTTANISDGTSNNRLQIYNINGNVGAFVGTGGVTQAALDAGTTSPVDTVIKGALAYATNDIAFVRNGGTVQTDTSATIPTVNSLTIGSEPASARVNGWVRSIRFYPTRLTNAQLQALTA